MAGTAMARLLAALSRLTARYFLSSNPIAPNIPKIIPDIKFTVVL
jgi:hypothetical protein